MSAWPTLFPLDDFLEGWKECPRCASFGYEAAYPVAFFRKIKGRNPSTGVTRNRARICMGCEDELDEHRGLRRSLNQRVIDHARRKGIPVKIYRERYGLQPQAVFDWFLAKIRSGVLDCGCLVSEMKHGFKDIEMHQREVAEPFFPHTWELVCTNDHRSMEHPDYPAIKRGWTLWKERRQHGSGGDAATG